MNQSLLDQSQTILAQLGQGHDFGRGVVALREMVRTQTVEVRYDQWVRPDATAGQVMRSARALLALGVDQDFERGVLALATTLLPWGVMVELIKSAVALRGMLPDREICDLPHHSGVPNSGSDAALSL